MSNKNVKRDSLEDLKKQISELLDKIYQLENIISAMPGHVYWLDKNNVYLGCNNEQAKSAGLKSRHEIIGKSNQDMIWKDIAEKVDKTNKLVMEKSEVLEFEEPALTTTGEKIFWSKKIPLQDKNGNLTGLLGISFDITDRKKTEEALRKAIKAKSEFLEVMSHDLRGPFNNILGATEVSKMYLKSGKPLNDVEEYLNIIPDEINRALDLLNNVNFLLALNDGKMNTEILSVDIIKTIKDILFEHKSTDSIKIETIKFHNIPEKIWVDVSNLYIALKIIINNAIRFTKKGSISVNIFLDDIKINHINIEISDTGCGMTLEQQENIFKAFLTDADLNERSHLRKPGLKLVIARKIIELIGGSFSIDSKPSIGTRIKLRIPFEIYKDGAIREIEIQKFRIEEKKNNSDDIGTIFPFSILLVEDDPLSLELESLALEALNQKVTKATTGKQAIKLAKKKKFDIIFLDITLPDIDGVEVAVQIREKWGDDITIVAVTSHTLEKDISLFTRYGMMTVIPKPANYTFFKEFLRDYTRALNQLND